MKCDKIHLCVLKGLLRFIPPPTTFIYVFPITITIPTIPSNESYTKPRIFHDEDLPGGQETTFRS